MYVCMTAKFIRVSVRFNIRVKDLFTNKLKIYKLHMDFNFDLDYGLNSIDKMMFESQIKCNNFKQ